DGIVGVVGDGELGPGTVLGADAVGAGLPARVGEEFPGSGGARRGVVGSELDRDVFGVGVRDGGRRRLTLAGEDLVDDRVPVDGDVHGAAGGGVGREGIGHR